VKVPQKVALHILSQSAAAADHHSSTVLQNLKHLCNSIKKVAQSPHLHSELQEHLATQEVLNLLPGC
jgi:hypothetical protein